MSYILDALKKSDQQRRRGVAPTLLAPNTAAVPSDPRRVSMPHVLLVAILIGAGIVIGALHPWQGEQPVSTQAPATVVRAPMPSVVISSTESNPLPPSSPAPAQVQPPAHPEQRIPVQETAAAIPSAPVAPPPVPVATPKPVVATVSPTLVNKQEIPAAPAAIQEQPVMTMAELPLSIQQEIPKMTITVHAYSRSTKDRLLGINDRMLKEGDYLMPGMLLEQITPEGMIMNYKGYRFRHGVR